MAEKVTAPVWPLLGQGWAQWERMPSLEEGLLGCGVQSKQMLSALGGPAHAGVKQHPAAPVFADNRLARLCLKADPASVSPSKGQVMEWVCIPLAFCSPHQDPPLGAAQPSWAPHLQLVLGLPPHSQSLPGRPAVSTQPWGLQREGERESQQARVQGTGLGEDFCRLSAQVHLFPPKPCSRPFSPWGSGRQTSWTLLGVPGHWAYGVHSANQPPLLGGPWRLGEGGMALAPVWPAERSPSPALPVCVQWLQQIEETEAALHRKMVDLESEKVGGRLALCVQHGVTRWMPEAETQVLLCSRSCSVSRRATWMRSWTTGSSPWTRLTR